MVATSTDLTDVILMGVENEYSVFLFDPDGNPLSPDGVEASVKRGLDDLFRDEAVPFLESHGGWALANGGRAYWDRLGRVRAAEYSTPEVRDPLDACAYVQAGHQFYLKLRDHLLQHDGGVGSAEVHLAGTCLSGSGNANGMHLNYFRRRDEPVTPLVPHLASLGCVTGTGGWATAPVPTTRFVHSPRAELIRKLTGDDSSSSRPLIDTYRKPYGAHRRVQEISGDAPHSMPQLYVRLASTALLLAMVDHWGLDVSRVGPADPLAALRAWNRDPGLRMPMADGRRASALDVQQRLADLVSGRLENPPGAVPAWANRSVELWRTLIGAARDEGDEARSALDWAVQRDLALGVCAESDVRWEELPPIAEALERLVSQLPAARRPADPAAWAATADARPAYESAPAVADGTPIPWERFARVVGSVQPILHWVSLQLSEVGGAAHRESEHAARRVLPELSRARIAAAAGRPPADTRARVRGTFVQRHAGGRGAAAGWDRLTTAGRSIDLPDPFSAEAVIE